MLCVFVALLVYRPFVPWKIKGMVENGQLTKAEREQVLSQVCVCVVGCMFVFYACVDWGSFPNVVEAFSCLYEP